MKIPQKDSFTLLHPEKSPTFQNRDEWHIKIRSLRKPHLLGRGVTGFTLIELMVVVIIIGILAGIIVPSHMRARERAMDKQAKAILYLIRAAERSYAMERGVYAVGFNALGQINSALNLDIADDGNWDYAITSNNGFNAILTRSVEHNGGYARNWSINAANVNATCTGNCP